MKKRTSFINCFQFRKNFKLQPIALSLLVAFGITACGADNTENLTIYSDVEDCISNNPNFEVQCRDIYQNAIQEAIETAPKYASIEECQADFGAENCQSVEQTANQSGIANQKTTSSHSSFMPLMAGFMMGNMLSNMSANKAHKPVYSPKDSSGRNTQFYDSTGKNYGQARSGSVVSVPKNDIKSQPAGTMKRGGFGQKVAQQQMAMQQKQSKNASSKSHSSRRNTSFGG